MNEKKKILILGAAALDLIVRVPRFAMVDDIVLASNIERKTGGSSANVGVGLGRLGNDVFFLSHLGDDWVGKELLDNFKRNGVNTDFIKIIKNRSSPQTLIFVDPHGKRLIYSLGGEGLIQKEDLRELKNLTSVSAVYIGEAYKDVSREIIEMVKDSKSKIFFCPGGIFVDKGLEELDTILNKTNYVIFSEMELFKLIGSSNSEEVLDIFSRYSNLTVVVTRGKRGSDLIFDKKIIHVNSFPSEPVDTTGAGDAFVVGFIHGILKGNDMKVAAMLGSIIASMVIEYVGAQEGLPYLNYLKNFLKSVGESVVI